MVVLGGIAVVVLAVLALIMAPGFEGNKMGETEEVEKAGMVENTEVMKVKAIEFEIYYSPACNCCKRYIAYLRGLNYTVKQIETSEVAEIKNSFGVPRDLWSCHTIKAEDYFIEGHVPVEAIQKLMIEKPNIKGIALPKMPPGSPGMGGNKTEPFRIYYVSESEKGEFMII